MTRLTCAAVALAVSVSSLAVAPAAEPASFAEATRAPYRPGDDKSRNGKSIAEMKKQVE
jgi:hypothetical protein